jgi:hypothetical protein
MKNPLERSPAFAPARAFVVQFGRETDVDTGRIARQVEHVVSEKADQFQSVDELMACMAAGPREVASTSYHPC